MHFEKEIDKSSFRVVSGYGDLCESLACDTIYLPKYVKTTQVHFHTTRLVPNMKICCDFTQEQLVKKQVQEQSSLTPLY